MNNKYQLFVGDKLDTKLARAIKLMTSCLLVSFLLVSTLNLNGLSDLFNNTKAQGELSIVSLSISSPQPLQSGGELSYQLELSESISDVTGVNIFYWVDNQGLMSDRSLYFDSSVNGNIIDLTTQIPQYNANGNWSISSIIISTQSQSYVFYYQAEPLSPSDFSFLTGNFTISDSIEDSTAPQLTQVRFSHDYVGPNTTVTVTVSAHEVGSGLLYAYVELARPNGERIGLGLSPSDQDLQGTHYIGQFDLEGDYKIARIIINDYAGNSIEYTNAEFYPESNNHYDFSGVGFTVEGTSPIPLDVVVEEIQLPTEELIADHVYPIKIRVSPIEQNYQFAYAYFLTPDNKERSIYLTYQENGIFIGEVNVRSYDASGTYKLKYLYFNVNQYTKISHNIDLTPDASVTFDFPNDSFIVVGTQADVTPPILETVSVLRSEMYAGQSNIISVIASDDHAMTQSVVVRYKNNQGESRDFWLGQKSENIFETSIYMDSSSAMTDWEVVYVELQDYAGNRSVYVNQSSENVEGYPVFDFQNSKFSVLGEVPRPEILSITNHQPIIGFNDYFHVDITFNNLDDPNVDIGMYFHGEFDSLWVNGQYIGNSTYSFTNFDLSWYHNGEYQIQYLNINTSDNSFEIFNSNVVTDHPYGADLSLADFHLLGGREIAPLPIIESFTVTPLGEPGDIITFELIFTEVFANIDQIYLFFGNQYGQHIDVQLHRTDMLKYTGTYNVHDYSKQGIYNFYSIAIYYIDSDPHQLSPGDELPALNFEITGTLTDTEPPVFISVESITKRVTKNEMGILQIRASDAQSGIEGVHADILCDGEWIGIDFSQVEENLFESWIDVRSYTPEGVCKFYVINIYDIAGNMEQIRNAEFDDTGVDLSNGDFEIYDTTSTSYVLNYVNTVLSKRSIAGSGDIGMTMYFDVPYIESHSIQAVFVNESGTELVFNLNKVDEGVYSSFMYINIYSTPGTFRLNRIISYADWVEVTIYHDDEPTEYPYFDFSDVYFEIVGTIEDKYAPQLYDVTLNRKSATINEKIEFIANATDVESEIEYASIEVQHIVSGSTFSMYFSPLMSEQLSAYFYVSPYMPEGNYRVKSIRLSDLAGNISEYINARFPYEGDQSKDFDHLDFSVYGTLKDNSKPVLNNFEFLKKDVSTSDHVDVLIDASDEGSGLRWGTVTLKHKTSGYEVEHYLSLLTRGLALTYIYISDDVPLGEYVIKAVKIEDQSGNIAQYCNSQVLYACNVGAIPFDFGANQITVSPRSEPQFIDIFDSVYISQNNLNTGDTVTIRLTLKEEYHWANLLFVHYDSYVDSAYFMPEFKSIGSGIFEANLKIDEYRRWNEYYKVQSVQLMSGLKDFYIFDDDYLDYYTDLKYVADLSQFNININQTFIDNTPPEFNGIQFSKDQYRHNDYMRITLDVVDLESRIESMMVYFRLNGKVMRQNTFLNGQFLPIEDGQLVYNEFFMSSGIKPGLYEIDYIQINNSFGLRTTLYNQKFYGERDDSRSFEDSKFELISEDYDYVRPEFISAQINKQEFVNGDQIQISIEASDIGSGIRTGYLFVKNRQSSYLDNQLREYTYYVELRKVSDSLLVAEWDVGPYYAPGQYDILELTLYDESFNRTTIKNAYFGIDTGSYDLSHLSFDVIGTQLDQELPELVSLEVLTPVVALGDSISVKVSANDLKSGVDFIDIVWECGSFGQIVIHGRAPKNPDEPIILNGYVRTSVKACDYKVKYVYLQDRAGNWRNYFNADVDQPQNGFLNFSNANIQVFGQTESVTLNQVQVSNANPVPLEMIEINVDILDNIVKPESAYIKYRSSINTVRNVDLSLGGSLDYRGLIEIGEFEPSAVWEVDSIIFIDRFNEEFAVYNSLYYPNEINAADMSGAMFTVDNPLGDSQAPEYTGSQLEKGEEIASVYSSRLMSFASSSLNLSSTLSSGLVFGPNELVSYTIDATDDISGVDRLEITYDILGKFISFNVELSEVNGKYVGNARVMSYHPEGLWLVHKFVLVDKAGNRYEKSRSATELSNLRGFAHLQLQVANTLEDKDAPVISDVVVNQSLVQVGDVVQYIGMASDVNGIKEFKIVIQAMNFGVERVIIMNQMEDGRYLGSFEVSENTLGDVWNVKEIIAEDFAGNRGIVTSQVQDLSSLSITVKALTEIVIEKLPDQMVYDLNDPLSLQGLILIAKYNDGTSESVDPSLLSVYGFDSSAESLNQDVYLQFKNKIAKITVIIMDVAMVNMEITASPQKLTYTQGESLDLSGLIVWGYYNSGDTKQIDITMDNVVNPNVTSSAPGTYQVFIQYEGFEVFYYIEVISPVQKDTPVTIVKTDTMMVITTPVGKVKVIMFSNKGSKNLDTE